MITVKYHCDWCGKEMSKLFYFTGSHIVIFGRYNYDNNAVKENEDSVCEECYNALKELRRTKQEQFLKEQ